MITAPQLIRTRSPATDLVEQGLVLSCVLDRDLVAAFLIRRGVRFSVVVRILAEPTRRRQVAVQSD